MLSLSSIAILEQSSSGLRQSLEVLFREHESFRRNLNTLRQIYTPPEVENKIKDGKRLYPHEKSSDKGMSFELRNVTFQYPGSTKTSNALNNISTSINAGQLVVIVGSNGSGKSTLIKLLARLYDPNSGSLLIDGNSANSYKMADLHDATAILSQDNHVFPLSLSENIGVGYPEHAHSNEMIAESAKKGGALAFISNYNDGFSTTLDPMVDIFSINVYGNHGHPLHDELEKLYKKSEISGGEKQRVVASRTFMRFSSGNVKFVAVDEPSSALDAEGELQLFQNLVEAREGKTMIFVTHRFGHLTRYADKIICMKDGTIAESGTHAELMECKGEYAKLYEIQASAFIKSETNGGICATA
ncbi:P-loop containing nucleoside triphosphate hydrolase protein [Cyathus striatus]|nr:P-loop containing nucleoside triphosphate hydrolase protein [Cyathus striatus]